MQSLHSVFFKSAREKYLSINPGTRDVPFVIFLSAVRCEVRLFLLVFLRCEVRLFQISLRSAAQSAKCEN